MRRVLPFVLLGTGAFLSTPARASNFCLTADPQLSFPGTSIPYVFAVTDDGSGNFGLYICSPTDLDLSWMSAGWSYADFNKDGWEDVVFGATSKSGGKVKLFLNDKTGSGTVVLSAVIPTGATAAPNEINALDLNGDGWTDILSANGTDGTFSVMLNDGTGAFPSVQQYAMGADVALLATMDVNGDGFPDMVTVSTLDQAVKVSLNNGDGTFAAPATYNVGGPVGTLSVADFNGDGYPDIFVSSVIEYDIFAPPPTSTTTGGSQKLLNNGDGTFSAAAWQPYSSGYSSGSLSISGVNVTVSATSLVGLFSGTGSTPGVTVASSGTVTLPPTSTPSTVTTNGGKSKPPSGTTNGSTSSGGGGAMEWFSIALLGLAGLRRKRL